MNTVRVKITVDEIDSLKSAVLTDETGAAWTLIDAGNGDILEQVLARLGYRALISQVDGEKTKEKILGSTGKEIVLSIRNDVDVDDAGERDWGIAAHVLVDGVLLGRFSFDTTCPLYREIETANGILKALGIEIQMEFPASAV